MKQLKRSERRCVVQEEDRVVSDFETSSSIKDVESLFQLRTFKLPSEGSDTRSKLQQHQLTKLHLKYSSRPSNTVSCARVRSAE